MWAAVRRLEARCRAGVGAEGRGGYGAGSKQTEDEDEMMVREFRKCHYYMFKEHGEMGYDCVIRNAKRAYKDALKAAENVK